MSKRYGRNQKRAHRTRIAELESQIEKLQKNHDYLWRANRDLVEEIDTAKRIVGEYCVAFNPHTQTMPLKATDFATIMQYEMDHRVSVSRYADFNPSSMQPVHINRIHLPIMCVLSDVEKLRQSRHVIVSYDGKAYGYGIDAAAWHMERYPEELCRRIAERMGHFIYEELTKNMGKRPAQFRDTPRRTNTRDEPEPRVTRPPFYFAPLPDFLR
jgi:hypothetical protein